MLSRKILLFGWLLFLPGLARAAEPLPLTFYPDWFPGAQFAGVYVALDRGYYRDAGLNVDLVPFAFGQKVNALIAAQPETSAVISIEGYIFLQKRAQGDDLVALGAMLQQGPAGFMSLRKSGIHRVQDFAGKTIGVHKFADPLYRWFTHRAGLAEGDATMIFVGNDLGQLTRGEVAAMQGFATEEFVHLQTLVGDATRQGWSEAFRDRQRAVASVHQRVGENCDDAFTLASLTALRAYVIPGGSAPMPKMDQRKWERLEQACISIGLLKVAEPIEKFLIDVEKSPPPQGAESVK